MSRKAFLRAGVVLMLSLAGMARSVSASLAAEPEIRKTDLQVGSPVSSLATRLDGPGFVVSFSKCKIGLLGPKIVLDRQWDIPGCKLIFTVHPDLHDGVQSLAGSTYVGKAVVVDASGLKEYPSHRAAVTDAFITPAGLLVASDDGTVKLVPTTADAAQRTLVRGQGVARVLLPDPAAQGSRPGFFVGFDSGRLLAMINGRVSRYETGVGRINGLAFSADREAILVAGFDGRLRSIDRRTADGRDIVSTGASINAIAVNGATNRVACVNDEGRLVVLDLSSGGTILDTKLTSGPVNAVAFDQDGQTVLAGDAAGLLYSVTLPPRP